MKRGGLRRRLSSEDDRKTQAQNTTNHNKPSPPPTQTPNPTTSDEVEAFGAALKPHQRALLPDGSTVLDRAAVQHNLLAASKLYRNVRLEDLGGLLGVPPARAEQVAADMIEEGRLKGSVDQVGGLVRFDDEEGPLEAWDARIKSVCARVNEVVEAFTELAGGAGGGGGGGAGGGAGGAGGGGAGPSTSGAVAVGR